jgi:hypothetical protein
MLQVLDGHIRFSPNSSKVAMLLHPQQSTRVMAGIFTGISGLALEAISVSLPESIQTLSKIAYRFYWEAPAAPLIFFSISALLP